MFKLNDKVRSTIDPTIEGVVIGFTNLEGRSDVHLVVFHLDAGAYHYSKDKNSSGIYVSTSVWHPQSCAKIEE